MAATDEPTKSNPALDPDTDVPDQPGLEFAQFGAGCFWGVELAYQRLEGVVKTEVGYSQGHVHDPTYKLVCTNSTNHVEVVRVQFDPNVCPYSNLLSLFCSRHDPTTLNRQPWRKKQCLMALEKLDYEAIEEEKWVFLSFAQMIDSNRRKGGDVGTQYRSGIYYYNEDQARLARESLEAKQLELKDKKIVTEVLPAKRFYRAEEYHQQYLEKGGGEGLKQSAAKGCNATIRCYG
ncbi:Peptide methionine sulfoxide reductase MsrA domain [Dillenia turbinata]|uniref:peptide-methionine (S)-S-oxide reductase n=1 Tax=Dillenia turbinata TaxID=194707 RepID=A0AAN8VBR5_9MAGN